MDEKHIFSSLCGRFCLNVSGKIFQKMLNECIKSGSFETGGILIGHYSSDLKDIIITYATIPTKDSKQGQTTFHRGKSGLLETLDSFWQNDEYYVGEWHFHPNYSSKPSGTDIKQMKYLGSSCKLKCPEPVLLVLGQNKKHGWEASSIIIKDGTVIPLYNGDKTSCYSLNE